MIFITNSDYVFILTNIGNVRKEYDLLILHFNTRMAFNAAVHKINTVNPDDCELFVNHDNRDICIKLNTLKYYK